LLGLSLKEHGTHMQIYFCAAQLSSAELLWKYTSIRDFSFLESWIQSKTCKKRKRSPPVCKNDSERTNEHTKEFQNCRIHTIKANLLFLFLFLLDRNRKWRWTAFSIVLVSESLRSHYLLFLSKNSTRLIYLFLLVRTGKLSPYFMTTFSLSRDKANNRRQPFVSILSEINFSKKPYFAFNFQKIQPFTEICFAAISMVK